MARSVELTPALRERICELHAIGWGYKHIHSRYPYVPRSTIQYTIKKESERRGGISKPRTGRPHKLSEVQKDRIREVLHGNPRIKHQDLLAEADYVIKLPAMKAFLKDESLRKWRSSWRPLLTTEYAQKRLAWALKYRHFTPEDWARVFFSDECTIERGIGVQREWTFIQPCEQPKTGQIQGLPYRGKQVKQMFWAAFSLSTRRTGLIPLFGDPNSERGGVTSIVIEELYRRILPTLLQYQDSIFQHDNAPTHTAFIVRETLGKLDIEVMDWPPHSPDLNPIENLWALLKAEVSKLRPELLNMRNNEESKQLLVETAQQAWSQMDLRHLEHLSETMPHRVQAILETDVWYSAIS